MVKIVMAIIHDNGIYEWEEIWTDVTTSKTA